MFVCIFTSHQWGYKSLSGMGEIIRFDKIQLFGRFNIYHLFTILFFIILFFVKYNQNRDVFCTRNYLKYIFLMYLIPVHILLYITIYIKKIHLDNLGTASIRTFFVYFVATYYIQDVFLKNKNYKQLFDILKVLEIFIFLRCCYSIIKYLIGYGYQDSLLEGRRLGYENDFADFYILLFIMALTNLLLNENNGRRINRLHILSLITSSIVIIFSFRRYFWVEFIAAIVIVLIAYCRSHRVNMGKLFISVCFLIVIVTNLILFVGVTKLTNNYYIGRFMSVFSLVDEKYNSQYGTKTGHDAEISDGWYNVKKHWLLGVTPYGNKLIIRLDATWQEGKTYVHNAFLGIWLLYGLLGLILFVILYWKSIKLGFELYKKGGLFGLILFTFCCVQTLKNIVWQTVITNVNVTIIYILIISIAIKMKQNTERK